MQNLVNSRAATPGTLSQFIHHRFSLHLLILTAVLSIILLPSKVSSAADPIYFKADFETKSDWTVNPFGTDTATTGQWEIGDPEETTRNDAPFQHPSTTSGSNALVTEAAAGDRIGANDIDNGITSVMSPKIAVPAIDFPAITFNYYFAHSSTSSEADYLRVQVVGSSTVTILEERGAADEDNGSWVNHTASLEQFAGETVIILIEAADNKDNSLVEAAIDDLQIMNIDLPRGVDYEYYEGTWTRLPDFDSLTPEATGTVDFFDISPQAQDDNFAFRFNSCISIETAGLYTFYTTSNDGSKLYIDGAEIVSNDGQHLPVTESGIVELGVGLYAIEVTFFEGSGTQELTVEYEGPGVSRQVIPADVLHLVECDLRPYNFGVAAQDDATGTGFIMYSAENIHTRFSANPPNSLQADHLVAVKYINNAWHYDTNGNYIPFAPAATDLLLADVDFGADTVNMLVGVNEYINEMRAGVASTDLIFTPDSWNGGTDIGEFGVTGTYFERYSGEPPTGPVIVNPGDFIAVEGDPLTINIVASDVNNETLTFTAVGLPTGFTIDAGSGQISGTLAEGDAAIYTVTVTVSDGTESDETTFTITGIPRKSEAGTVTVNQSSATQWRVVNFQYSYKNPVVVMGPPSFNDAEPLTIRVRNVTGSSFEYQLDEWDYQDDSHGSETIGYLVAEAGKYILHNGDTLLAGITREVTENNTTVTFSEAFTTTPVVLAQVASDNEITAVTQRLTNIGPTQFDVKVQEEEAADGLHAGELIHWIALEPVVENGNFEAAATGIVIDEAVSTLTFAQTYSAPPIFIATMQTTQGNDPAVLRHLNLTENAVDIFAEEEQSANEEVSHAAEAVGYLVIDPQINNNPFDQIPNVSPVITNPGNQTSIVGSTISLQIVATDADNDPLTYSASGLPDGLTIDPNTGLISGEPTVVDVFAVDIKVKDTHESVDTASFVWTIEEEPNTPPVLTNPGDQVNTINDVVSLSLTATDADNDTLTFSAENLPTGLTISETTGEISGTVTEINLFAVSITVDDGNGGTDTAVFSWTVEDFPNNPPVLVNPGDQVNTINDDISLSLEATDADDDPLTFTAENLPTGLTIDADSGLISGSVTDVDSYAVVITVQDGNDGSDTAVFSWTVNDEPNTAPVLTDPGDQENTVGDIIFLLIDATDAEDDPLTFTAEDLPAGLNINGDSGVISGTLTTADSHAVIVTATDDKGASGIVVFAWTVNDPPNTPPEITNPGDQENMLNDVVSLQIEASDADQDVLTFTAVNLPESLTIDPDTGLITGTLTQVGEFAVVVTVEDDAGDSANTIFNWTINDITDPNNNPVIQSPGDQVSMVGDSISLDIDATDVDGDTLTYSAENLPAGLEIAPDTGLITGLLSAAGQNAVVVRVDDGNGGTDSAVFSWTVNEIPNNPPLITEPEDQTNTLGDVVNLAVEATDEDGDVLEFSAVNLPPGLSIDSASGIISGETTQAGQFGVIVSVVDGNGGSDDASFLWVVEVEPNVDPTIVDPGNQLSIINDIVSLQIEASDDNDDILTFDVINLPTGLSLDEETGLITGQVTEINIHSVLVTVYDGQGGSANTTFIWEVTDIPNTAPEITNPGTQSNLVNDQSELQIEAADAEGDTLTYAATNLPDGLTINPDTGAVTGTFTKAGTYLVVVTVEDGRDSDEMSFIWFVEAVEPVVEIFMAYLPVAQNQFKVDEPNNLCVQAHPIAINTEYHYLHEDINDWYVFTTTTTQSLRVELSNYTASGQIIVYRGSCSALEFLQNNGDFNSSKTIDLGQSPPGTYFIRIISDDSHTDLTPYRLFVDGS